jgi:hypothetical protein
MRIYGPSGPSAAATPAAPRRPAQSTFTPAEPDAGRAAAGAAALRTVGGIDALLALQGVEDAVERRKRGINRGRLALTALEELKIGLLGGALEGATLGKLKAAAAFLKDGTGDAGLDGVLGEIELRAEVEIAKMAAR